MWILVIVLSDKIIKVKVILLYHLELPLTKFNLLHVTTDILSSPQPSKANVHLHTKVRLHNTQVHLHNTQVHQDKSRTKANLDNTRTKLRTTNTGNLQIMVSISEITTKMLYRRVLNPRPKTSSNDRYLS